MRNGDPEIGALRDSIDKLTVQIERLIRRLESPSPAVESEQAAQLRDLLDRPDVEPEDRNTPGESPGEDDDTARV